MNHVLHDLRTFDDEDFPVTSEFDDINHCSFPVKGFELLTFPHSIAEFRAKMLQEFWQDRADSRKSETLPIFEKTGWVGFFLRFGNSQK